MAVAQPVDDPAFEDLTTRARIRDAALRLFAERGIDGATIRDIAREAGVSAGLIRHHFGSKEALREACDTYATNLMNRLRDQMFTEGRLADQAFVVSTNPTSRLMQTYLVQSMMDGSPPAAAMFDEMVRLGERALVDAKIESADLRAYAAVLTATQLGVFLMREQLSRALGADIRTPEGHLRMSRGLVDFHSHALLSRDQAAQLHAAMDQLQTPPPDRGVPDAAHSKEWHDDDRGDPD